MVKILNGINYSTKDLFDFLENQYMDFNFKSLEGKVCLISQKLTVSANNSLSILFQNNSDYNTLINFINILSSVPLEIEIYKNETISSNGTTIPISSTNLLVPSPQNILTEYGGTYSTNNPFLFTLTNNKISSPLVINKTNNIHIKINNSTANNVDIYLNIQFTLIGE